ncbi:MAG: hypothetical protein JW829_13225 [Pirellulales bacterium]|nr:hypothetical protein [Pirellulales bacterium]
MCFHIFLQDLIETGNVQVPKIAPIGQEELSQAKERLEAFELVYRRQLAGIPPVLVWEPALWAAMIFYRSCQFLVYRGYNISDLSEVFSEPCPDTSSPSAHYSVDLTFRMLPDLARLACATSKEDPLVLHLNQLATKWPLSSVGMVDAVISLESTHVTPIIQNRSLLILYIDRIIARGDTSRLADLRISDAVKCALGLFSELSPKIASALDMKAMKEITA